MFSNKGSSSKAANTGTTGRNRRLTNTNASIVDEQESLQISSSVTSDMSLLGLLVGGRRRRPRDQQTSMTDENSRSNLVLVLNQALDLIQTMDVQQQTQQQHRPYTTRREAEQ